MPKRRLVVIVDQSARGDQIAEWQHRSLATLSSNDELILLACNNTQPRRDLLRYPLYYAVNLITVRNRLTRKVPLGALSKNVVERLDFASEADGIWQVLPKDIVDHIAKSGAVAVIKFGMGLLRVPPELKIPILSWHHGDPEHFRGRPAGFWELLSDQRTLGQMVQVISNKLDSGRVVAYADTRIIQHSWKATLLEAFRHSPLLLAPALENALRDQHPAKPTTGRNYKLPGNRYVLRLLLRLLAAKLKWLAIGVLFEKRWRVSRADVSTGEQAVSIASGTRLIGPESQWWTPPIPPGCVFIADPFFGSDRDELLVEALSRWGGIGQIHKIVKSGSTRLSAGRKHHSYPALIECRGEILCVPETAQWSGPTAYRWQTEWEARSKLRIEGDQRLTDPTFFEHQGQLYVFANDARFGSGVLRLWHAPGLLDVFVEHPASPLRISPRGSRMGGNLLVCDDQIIRLGQDCSRDYGDGLIAFQIEELSPTRYREREIGSMRFDDRKGPHTFNLSADRQAIVFDWYHETFTVMAGFRRAMARLLK